MGVVPRHDASVSGASQTIYKYISPVRKRARADVMEFREGVLFNAVQKGTEGSKDLRKIAIDHMKRQLPNHPHLWEKLTPKYPVGCKRAIISSDFYPTLGQDHVHLETRRLKRITANGIEVDGEKQSFDVIVLATGFQTGNFLRGSINVTGSGGRSLRSIWQKSPRALYGVTVESLPNFAMLYGDYQWALLVQSTLLRKYTGPNTNLGHNSIVLMIEAQSRYINGMISAVLQARLLRQSLSIRPNVERLAQYNEDIQKVLSQSSYADPSCDSWYKNADGKQTGLGV